MNLETFGAILKRERELRRITLHEVAEATRIHPKYIEAIEQEHFEKLPGLTFLKGYVRAYGNFVGLNVEELMLRLEPLIAQMDEERPLPPSKKKRYLWAIGFACLAAGLFLFFRGCFR
jgi:cytoskeletal protein RodZ